MADRHRRIGEQVREANGRLGPIPQGGTDQACWDEETEQHSGPFALHHADSGEGVEAGRMSGGSRRTGAGGGVSRTVTGWGAGGGAVFGGAGGGGGADVSRTATGSGAGGEAIGAGCLASACGTRLSFNWSSR